MLCVGVMYYNNYNTICLWCYYCSHLVMMSLNVTMACCLWPGGIICRPPWASSQFTTSPCVDSNCPPQGSEGDHQLFVSHESHTGRQLIGWIHEGHVSKGDHIFVLGYTTETCQTCVAISQICPKWLTQETVSGNSDLNILTLVTYMYLNTCTYLGFRISSY